MSEMSSVVVVAHTSVDPQTKHRPMSTPRREASHNARNGASNCQLISSTTPTFVLAQTLSLPVGEASVIDMQASRHFECRATRSVKLVWP